ncbi:MAG: DNA polymerase I [Bacteroidaceae bacterium]|nr:DNA polymerase I [Bacteroidaceae bacterium]
MKLFLLDAYALIYRAYYAFIKNPRYNSKGENTSAILGFVNTLEDVLRNMRPTHLGVAFDPHGGTFRHEAFPDYKAQREETPEAIRFAVPKIKEILEAYHIPVLEVQGYEADDVIGTLAHQADLQGIETYMMTPDKDYGQLVTNNVSMYRPPVGKSEAQVMGPKEICEKWGIESPLQVIDILGLMGDSSDNIPGCPGVGEKTACTLIQQWGSIENLLNNTDKLKGAIQRKVTENAELIRQSHWLATIVKDAPITLDMKALEIKEPDHNALQEIYEELEFRQLLKKTLPPAPPKGGEWSQPTSNTSIHNTTLSKKGEGGGASMLGGNFRFKDGSIQGDLFSDIVSNTPVTTPSHTGEGRGGVLPMDEPPFILDGNTIIGHDLKAHWQELTAQYPEVQTFGLETDGVGEKQLFDTAIAHYLLHPEMRHGLDYLKDAYRKATLKELKELFEKELHDTGLWDIFRQMEMPLMCVLARMEQTGVRIDEPGLAETSRHFTEEMMHLEEEIYRLAGQRFNIASPRQVGEILFDVLQLDSKAKKTKTGQYVTGEEVLEGLRHKHEVVGKILEHRGLKKLLGTYIDALPKLVNASTGHIHTTFNQTVTTTGRLSSSNPNLQNIPVRDAMGKEVRKAFIPDEGQLFFSADYSQIELRIMAHLSKDENLVQAFLCGEDIHAATAAKIFHKDISEVTSDERRRAKTANFGIIYGISAFGLAERLGCSRSEAKQLIDGYFLTYPGVKEYMERSIAMAREKGYTETIFHRRCPLPDINSHNAVVRGYAERNAINSPIQGSAADIMKIAMIRVDRRMRREGLRSRMILQVHDELNFSVLPEERDQLQRLVIEEMQNAASLTVPLIADAGWGSNWLEAH